MKIPYTIYKQIDVMIVSLLQIKKWFDTWKKWIQNKEHQVRIKQFHIRVPTKNRKFSLTQHNK